MFRKVLAAVPSALLALVLATLALAPPVPARADEGSPGDGPAFDVRCALGEPAEDGTRWLAVAAVDPDGNLVPGEEGEVTVELRGGATFEGRVLRGLLLEGRGEETARVRLAAGAAQVLLAGAAGEDVAARVVLDGTPGEWVPAPALPEGAEPVEAPPRPLRLPPLPPGTGEDADEPPVELVRLGWDGPAVPGEPVLLRARALGPDGDVTDALDGSETWIALAGADATFTGNCPRGKLVDGAGTAWAIAHFENGELALEVLPRTEGELLVTLQWRRGDTLRLRDTRIETGPASSSATEEDEEATGDHPVPDTGVRPPSHTPWELPFEVTDAVFDPVKPRLWVSSTKDRAVYLVNLRSGRAVRKWSFDHGPENLAITPDGSRLFATIPTGPHRPWGSGNRPGYVASWNLEEKVLDRYFRVDFDPYRAVATSDGHLVISDGSRDRLHVVDATDGHETGSDWYADRMAWLALHPDEERVYAVYGYHMGSVERYDLLPDGRIRYRDHYYDTSLRSHGRAWVHPDGTRLLLGGGDVLALSPGSGTPMRPAGAFSYHVVYDLGIDEDNRVIAGAEREWIRYYNLETLIRFRERFLGGSAQFVGFSEGRVLALQVHGGTTTIARLAHPAPDGANNTAPEAHVEIHPSHPTTADEVTFDASSSHDNEDPPEDLRFRWDLDDDGTWDTALSSDPVISRRYPLPGARAVRVQVVDSLGLADVARVPFDVSFRPDPGEAGPNHPPYELPWGVSDIAFESARDRAWIASFRAKRVSLVDLERGVVLRTWPLEIRPKALSLSPDGKRLFMVGATPLTDWWNDDSEPWMGSWDLESGLMDRLVPIGPRATRVVAGPPGVVLVFEKGAGAFSIDATSGATLDGPVCRGARGDIVGHPGGTWFYVLGSNGSPASHVEVAPDGGLILRWSRTTSWSGIPWWTFLGGARALTARGRVYACSSDEATDLAKLGVLPGGDGIRSAATDAPVLAALRRGSLSYYDTTTLEQFSSIEGVPIGSFVGFTTRHVATVGTDGRIFLFEHPAPGGTWEQPPEARLEVSPSNPTQLDEIVLDASGSSDPESPLEDLRFRWDLDGDGTWDTDWSSEPTRTVPRKEPGVHLFRVEVQDPCGARSVAERTVTVVFVPDPGEPVPAHHPFRLPFVLDSTRFLPGRPFFLANVEKEKAIYLVDTRTGLAVRRWIFPCSPTKLRVSPDGSRAHAVLPVRAASGWPRTDGEARLVSWNLETMTLDRYLRIPVAIRDYVVTTDGFYVISRHEGPTTALVVADPTDGRVIDQPDCPGRDVYLALHPDGRRLYAAAAYGSLLLFSVEPGGRVRYERTFRYGYHDRPCHRLWISPRGDRLISACHTLHEIFDDPARQPVFLRNVPTRYRYLREVVFDGRNREFFLATSRGIERYDTDSGDLVETFASSTDFRSAGKVGKLLFGLHGWWANGVTFMPRWEINHPPVAVAGEDQVLECTGNLSATATLDGSGSWDPDSEGEPDQDIASWDWFEGETSLASGKVVDVPFSLGEHDVTLVVTDRSDATDDDAVRVTVRDTIAPAGSITWPPAGACFGPAAVPVTVRDDVVDSCDPGPARTYVPGPGPAYADHGDHDVTLVVTDVAGNEFRAHVPFTIDLVPPVIVVHSPDPGWVLGPGSVPASLAFTATDDDGAAGDVVHEWIEIEGCIAWDGNDYGDGDGLLSDEEIPLGPAELCRVVSTCGFGALHDPLVTIHAVDCGGNETAVSRRIPGSFTPLPGLCPP